MIDYLRVCQNFLGNLQHSQFIDFKILEVTSETSTTYVAPKPELVGDPDSGVVHGGVITTMMDMGMASATVGYILSRGLPFELMPTLDLRVDYMRPATPGVGVTVTSECYRLTSSVAFTRGTAWQEGDDRPIAFGTGTFMRIGPEMIPKEFVEMVMEGAVHAD